MIIWSNGNIAVAIAVLGKNNASGSLAHIGQTRVKPLNLTLYHNHVKSLIL